jgi:putative membrane protein
MLLIVRWLALAGTVWVATILVSGIEVDGGWGTYVLVAVVLATVNAVLGTLLRFLTLPLIILTLGIFSLVISAWMLLVTDWLMDTFTVDGFDAAFLGAVVIATVNVIVNFLLLSVDHYLEESRPPA